MVDLGAFPLCNSVQKSMQIAEFCLRKLAGKMPGITVNQRQTDFKLALAELSQADLSGACVFLNNGALNQPVARH